jgi:cholesterol transport system auxiliary component
MMAGFTRRTQSIALACFLGGCALLGKSEPFVPRYFSPDSAPRVAPASSSAAAKGTLLKLGRITAASYLGERIVFRDSNYELSFYEDRRWTERPEDYLRRALARALFEEHGLRRIVSGGGPTLDVELVEFAELRRASPVARVTATYILYDVRFVRREATVTVELPIARPNPNTESAESAVRVMTAALNEAVQRIVAQVLIDLRTGEPTLTPQELSSDTIPGRAPDRR